MKKRDWPLTILQIVKWVLLADGVIFGLLAIGFAVNTMLFVKNASQTTGTVTQMDQHQDDEGSVTYSPVVTFVTQAGVTVTVHSNSSSNPPGFEIGDKVLVRYESPNPANARIATFWQTWALAAGFGIASVVTTVLGVLFIFFVRRRKTRMPRLQKISSLDQI